MSYQHYNGILGRAAMEKLNYWTKITTSHPFSDLEWNIPEQKTGVFNLIGGNVNSFSAVAQNAEFFSTNSAIKTLNILLPDSLKNKLPPVPNVSFLPSTESGSFAKSTILDQFVADADSSIFIGDVSKNSATTIALSSAINKSEKPIIITRDTIDTLTPEMLSIIEHGHLFIIGSLAQIQKIFRVVFYPKMILLSMPLIPIIEVLHKFTLSYPVTILTFHQGQIIVSSHGKITTMPIEKTSYTPISLWNGDLACKIAENNFFTPNHPLEATTFSINSHSHIGT